MKLNHFALNLAAVGVFCLVGASAHSQNLILNGSFEDNGGSFDNWNVNNNSGYLTIDDGTIMSTVPEDGSQFAVFGASPPTPDSIDQSIATTPGLSYDVNFWVNDKYGSSSLVVNWGNNQLLNLPTSYNSGAYNNGWVNFDFVIQATSASADLSFAGFSAGAIGLDNVVVTQVVPEPSSIAFAGLGVTGLILFGRYRRTW